MKDTVQRNEGKELSHERGHDNETKKKKIGTELNRALLSRLCDTAAQLQ